MHHWILLQQELPHSVVFVKHHRIRNGISSGREISKMGKLVCNLLPQALHCKVESEGITRSQLDRTLLPLVYQFFKNSNTSFQIVVIEILLLTQPTNRRDTNKYQVTNNSYLGKEKSETYPVLAAISVLGESPDGDRSRFLS